MSLHADMSIISELRWLQDDELLALSYHGMFCIRFFTSAWHFNPLARPYDALVLQSALLISR